MMMHHDRVTFNRVNHCVPQSVSAIHPPATTAASSSTTPISDTSVTRPGRNTRRYRPMKMAIGIVIAMENTPQGLSARALTTTSASTASRITMITSTPMIAAAPPTGPSSSRAICPSERPRRRVEIESTRKSWTQPANTAPSRIQMVPGR